MEYLPAGVLNNLDLLKIYTTFQDDVPSHTQRRIEITSRPDFRGPFEQAVLRGLQYG